MKLGITVEFNNGTFETYTAQPPEWVKWEKSTGFIVSQAQEKIGIADLVFLAYHAMKREAGGKPVKTLDQWTESVAGIEVGEGNPKVTNAEA
jgi:hypothetical protein|tara:strand:- start:2145 stop:2420 length:276 start_codon:yes stop_codon:yes gene_type:complete